MNRKLVNFKDFSDKNNKKTNEDFGGAPGFCNISIEGDGLVKRYTIQAVLNSLRNIGGKINLTIDGEKFSPITGRKVEKRNDSVNESSIDYDIMDNIKNIEAYKTLKEDLNRSIGSFNKELEKVADEIGYDEGDNDHQMAYSAAIQEAMDSNIK